MILMAPQQATSPKFQNTTASLKMSARRQQMSFRGRSRQWTRKSYDHDVLHRKETHRV
jgi:hypothetical protein